ncbi:hypothetical protein P9850_01915 [Anoxybacillus rupiensis]|uniref:Transposase n=1 Tax=Anoxybacteroides rupiense TaxID=311460 RepID=A0ABD5IT75_9BACL|nr:hypothetical protein [Anoxybacillus rupiensis]
MSKLDKLTELYKKAASLNEELPAQLIEKMSLYGQIYELLGFLHAEAEGDYGLKEAERKEVIATVFCLDPEKTVKEREMKAELASVPKRKEEAEARKEAIRWKNARESVLEQINIMKKKYEHLVNVLQKGGI